VALSGSAASGLTVGTSIVWTPIASGADPDVVVLHRFLVSFDGGPFQTRRHSFPGGTWRWTPTEEGNYVIRVEATGKDEVSAVELALTVAPLSETEAAVAPTEHPLVALYSAPACEGKVRAQFGEDGVSWRSTPWKPCRAGKSVTFYVAGMRANTGYLIRHQVENGEGRNPAPAVDFMTGDLDVVLPAKVVSDPTESTLDADRDFLMSVLLYSAPKGTPVVTDLAGEVVWYYNTPGLLDGRGSWMSRWVPGGTGLIIDVSEPPDSHLLLREIDVAGNILRETSLFAVNEQLIALGKEPLTRINRFVDPFHHDAIRLPNGHTAVLLYRRKVLVDTQGPGEVEVLGDDIVVLDEDWKVVWTWSGFDYLDPHRTALLNQACPASSEDGPDCTDWTHSNSLAYDPSDGNLLLSVRHQDWIVKIDYNDGIGSGDIVWRLGEDGDFLVESEDDWPWFSHPHDAEIQNGRLLLYDNGNVRQSSIADAHSRGQAFVLDEANRTARLALNADLGVYAPFVGSIEELPNGNLSAMSGALSRPNAAPSFSQTLETLPDGTPTGYVFEWDTLAYRSFRLTSLYGPLTDIAPDTIVNAASFASGAAAPGEIVSLFGRDLASGSGRASVTPLPTGLNGTSVTITDSVGVEHVSELLFVSARQVNCLVPVDAALGTATLVIWTAQGTSVEVALEIAAAAPGLFSTSEDGQGAASARYVRVAGDGSQTEERTFDPASGEAVSINLGAGDDQVFLLLFGTGIRGATTVAATIGGIALPVTYAGSQEGFAGLDQVNVGPIPMSLAGIGEATVLLAVDGAQTNAVTVRF